ncbi:MAG TPA: AI-2E family transporter [Actinomycetota bacterium]|nr:AI-2E family transporter [Actinomycetota bacterium]
MSRSERDVPQLLDWAAAVAWRLLVIAAAATVVGFLVARLTLVVIPTLIALLVASVLHPPAARLSARGVPPAVSAFLVFLTVVLAVGAGVAYIAPAVAEEVSDAGTTLSSAQNGLAGWLEDEPFGISRSDAGDYIDRIGDQIAENRSRIATGVLGAAAGLVQIVGATALAIVLAFFFVKDRDRMWGFIVVQFPEERKNDVGEAGRRAWEAMQGYVRGITIIAVVDAVLIGIALVILDVPLALPLSVLVFLGAFVPIIGAFVSGLVAVVIALITRGIAEAAIIAVVITAIQQLEGNILQPVVMGRTVKLHPVVILLAVATGVIVAGIAGAFLAVPVVATTTAAGSYLKRVREERSHDPIADGPAAERA